jgi:hypothetical protein
VAFPRASAAGTLAHVYARNEDGTGARECARMDCFNERKGPEVMQLSQGGHLEGARILGLSARAGARGDLIVGNASPAGQAVRAYRPVRANANQY